MTTLGHVTTLSSPTWLTHFICHTISPFLRADAGALLACGCIGPYILEIVMHHCLWPCKFPFSPGGRGKPGSRPGSVRDHPDEDAAEGQAGGASKHEHGGSGSTEQWASVAPA